VRNNTRVIPARVPAKNAEGQKCEVFLLKPLGKEFSSWSCLFKPAKKVKTSLPLFLKDGSLVHVLRNSDGSFQVTLPEKKEFWTWLSTVGEPPLPPYIKRNISPEDAERYQTVFSKELGSVAAPTAGLHFTEGLLEKLKNQRVNFADITLHVGYGTFAPIRVDHIEEHRMHEESFFVPEETLNQIRSSRSLGGRVIAVGTTSLRTLESIPQAGNSGNTDLYITPGYQFTEIDGLITNFHLPQSTLYVLVYSLLGGELCKRAYQEAIEKEYRFYSYGDAMLVL